VVRVRELGFEAGEPFIVMDYVEGASLSELRKELVSAERAVDTKVAVRVVLDALAGLHAAHELKDENGKPLGIIHRDISPHNVLIGCDGRVRLTDFGIAHAEDRVQTTRTHEVKGKLAYLAPERIDRRRICTKQSDLFSMAVVLWECLAGRRLFRSEDAVDVLQEVLNSRIPTLRQVGAHVGEVLGDVVARALSRDLDTRYKTALEFVRAIEGAAGADIASHDDVARLIDAVFGPRMAQRQSGMRSAVGTDALAELLEQSGLPARDDAPEGPGARVLAELAPPVPPESARYARRAPAGVLASFKLRRVPWWAVAVASAGVVAGSLTTLAVRANRSQSGPIVVVARAATSASSTSTTRRVVVPLPFPATRVTLDEAARDLDPASDVAAFDLPSESGLRHRVVALALDGTRAEGYVREDEGVARPDGEGYSYVEAPRPAAGDPSRSTGTGVHAVGETRNGFTKLR
jgi:hypothetical protein